MNRWPQSHKHILERSNNMNFLTLIIYGGVTLVISVFTFVLFAVDKVNASERGYYFRIPERTLIFFSVLGGCFGALLAMALLRHKSNALRKNYFRIVIYIAVGLWIVTAIAMLFLSKEF